MAIALATSLPLFLYLAGQCQNKYMKTALHTVFALTIIAILGTHSRGGLVALVVCGFGLMLYSRQKVILTVVLFFLALPGLAFMPSEWFQRMSTISSATEDASFMGRVDAWVINYKLAKKHPLTGEDVPWSMIRPGHHCGMLTGASNLLMFRSGYTGFFNLEPCGTLF